MNWTAPLLVVVVLLLAGLAGPVGGSMTSAAGTVDHAPQEETPTATNESDEPAEPGARFAGVVAVQGAEVESEMDGRTFGIRVARANSNDSKAGVVADRVEETARRTEELHERKQELEEARENGNISQSRYRAEVAAFAARTSAVERQLNQAEAASRDLPAGLLESKGVNATAIARLRNDSRNLSGPETAEIARSIAGPGAGAGLSGNDTTRGPPATAPGRSGASNGSDRGPPQTGDGNETATPRGSPAAPPARTDSTRSTPPGAGGNSTDAPGNPGGGGPPSETGPPARYVGDAYAQLVADTGVAP